MIHTRPVRTVVFALAAPAFVAGAAVAVSAQGSSPGHSPQAPKGSTTLTAPSGGTLVKVFDAPPAPPAEDVAKPNAAETVTTPEAICSTGDASVDVLVREAGSRYGIDPCLVSAVMAQESGFRRFAV